MIMLSLVAVSQATLLLVSPLKHASSIASETWSHNLSGWPSFTDFEDDRNTCSLLGGRPVIGDVEAVVVGILQGRLCSAITERVLPLTCVPRIMRGSEPCGASRGRLSHSCGRGPTFMPILCGLIDGLWHACIHQTARTGDAHDAAGDEAVAIAD